MAFSGVPPDLLALYQTTTVADPPPGVTPDFANSHRTLTRVTALATVCLVLTTAFVAVRIYTRFVIVKDLWWDDYLSLASWLLFIPFTAFVIKSSRDGTGRHVWNVHYSDVVQIRYDTSIVQRMYFIPIVTVKLSILAQFLRVFVPSRRGNEVMFYGAVSQMALNVIFYTVQFFFHIFQCSPRAKVWNRQLPGTCVRDDTFLDPSVVPTAGFNVASDIIILLLPLNRVWRLQLPLRAKLGVCLVFGTGAIVCLTSILRLYYSFRFSGAADGIYWEAFLVAWTYLEVAVGIMVGCMPSTPKFVQHLRDLLKKNAAVATRRPRSSTTQRETKTGQSRDPYDVHRHLNEREPHHGDRSSVELHEYKNNSLSTKGSLV